MKTQTEIDAIASYRAVRNEAGKDSLKALFTFFIVFPAVVAFLAYLAM